MSQNNKTILATTLINFLIFGLTVSPLFEEMNLLRFLLFGFGVICILTPLMFLDNKSDD